jgi:hypothetical protein
VRVRVRRVAVRRALRCGAVLGRAVCGTPRYAGAAGQSAIERWNWRMAMGAATAMMTAEAITV